MSDGVPVTINITSPVSVSSSTAHFIDGNIENSGDILVNSLEVFVGDTCYKTDVAPNGDFSVAVNLVSGDNYLQFVTTGDVYSLSEQKFRPITLHNNIEYSGFVLNLNLPKSLILVTTTWILTIRISTRMS